MGAILSGITNWRTTLAATIGFVVYVLGQFGVVITPEQSNAVVVVIMMIIGFLAKDATTGSQPKL